jgi:lysozyme family protein
VKENFQKSLDFVLRWEGEYSFDPADPGGETHWGISKRAYPAMDIKNLTRTQAQEIYFHDYWLRAGCDDLPWPMDIIVFDTAVNMGIPRAKTLFQDSIDWKEYLFMRIGAYTLIVQPRTLKFLKGWINRVLDLRKTIG